MKQSIYKNNNDFKKVFTTIYDDKEWGVSRNSNTSGTGDILSNLAFFQFFELFLTKTGIESLLDFGCGDWSLLKHINFPSNLKYTGIDVVDSVIKSNNNRFSINKNIKFYTVSNNYVELLQNKKFKSEVLLVKNIFENWSLDNISTFIKQVLPNFKYVLFAAFYNPKGQNVDVPLGWFHTLNMIDFEYPQGSEIKFLFASEVFDGTFNAYYLWGQKLDNNIIEDMNYIIKDLKSLKSISIVDNLQSLDNHIKQNLKFSDYPNKINNLRKKYSIDKFIWGSNNQISIEKDKEPMRVIIAGFEYAQLISIKGFNKLFEVIYREEGLYEISFNNADNKLFLYSFNEDIEKLMPYLLNSDLFYFS